MLLHALLDTIPFFNDFTMKEKDLLIESDSFFMTHPAGVHLITEGGIDTNFFILLEGSVQVNKRGTIITELEPGAVFGEMAFLSQEKRTTNIITNEKVRVFQVDGKSFEHLDPNLQIKLQKKLIAILVTRLNDMNKALIAMAR